VPVPGMDFAVRPALRPRAPAAEPRGDPLERLLPEEPEGGGHPPREVLDRLDVVELAELLVGAVLARAPLDGVAAIGADVETGPVRLQEPGDPRVLGGDLEARMPNAEVMPVRRPHVGVEPQVRDETGSLRMEVEHHEPGDRARHGREGGVPWWRAHESN
jgi:hypothetical protein